MALLIERFYIIFSNHLRNSLFFLEILDGKFRQSASIIQMFVKENKETPPLRRWYGEDRGPLDSGHLTTRWASLAAPAVKSLPAMQEIRVPSLGGEDPLEKGMATHSGMLAWEIPWTEKPGRLQLDGKPESVQQLRGGVSSGREGKRLWASSGWGAAQFWLFWRTLTPSSTFWTSSLCIVTESFHSSNTPVTART